MLEYKPLSNDNHNKRKRKRNITWFNPPFSANVKTNVGKQFLNIVDQCFPSSNALHKIINRNTVKVSYHCMDNIKNIISKHNGKILRANKTQDNTKNECNCRSGKTCPLDKKCLTSGIVYQASVKREDNNKIETYIGLTNNTFKTRFTAHISSFRHQDKRLETALSKYIWTLKDSSITHAIQWKIIRKCNAYSTTSKSCNLCLTEKYFIIFRADMASLNNRNELATECRHRKKHLLSNNR